MARSKGSEEVKNTVKAYSTVSLPAALIEQVRSELDGFGFRSNAERVSFIIRDFIIRAQERRAAPIVGRVPSVASAKPAK